MSFSYKIKSHDNQLLITHLKETADIALESHRSHGGSADLEDIIKIICMCHDFGKATMYFQKYLVNEYDGTKKNHGELSALFTYWMLPKTWKHIGYIIVKRHHGNMNNALDEVNYMTFSDDIDDQIESIKENYMEELEVIYNISLDEFFNFVSNVSNMKGIKRNFQKMVAKNQITINQFIISQYIYSLLLTADKSQLIIQKAFIPDKPFPYRYVYNYKENIIKKCLKKKPQLSESLIFKLRNEIYNELMQNINKIDISKDKILSINVPTGSGKTILAYQSAFLLSEKLYKVNNGVYPQIIYCLPYTGVIDQNYEVLYELLEENLNRKPNDEEIIKYHSLVPIEYKDFKGYDARFCFENWQSKIITTTFVQLFNTIFKTGKNSIMHRMHRLSNSIIILDEVQAIEPKYYSLIRKFFDYLQDKFNIYIILVTATMPYLLETKELIQNKEMYFRKLNRIEIHNFSYQKTPIDEFCNIVKDDIINHQDKSFLIILNTVKSSKKVYEELKELDRKVLYLSTEIYPKLRLKKIQDIVKSEEKYVVVSTQLIEAGVDIDMDVVYRDFAPLDSINQSAGRANRNGIGGKGVVKLYKLIDDNENAFCQYIYPKYLLNITEKILADKKVIYENEIYDFNVEYFNKLNKAVSQDKSDELLSMIPKMEFKDFRENFKLIDNKDELVREDLFVIADDNAKEIVRYLCKTKKNKSIELKNKFRELNQYRVSVSKKELNSIDYDEETLKEYQIKIINEENYNINTGIIRKSLMQF